MYASFIGKKLVELTNKEQKTTKTVREFFDTAYFPLFYDNPKYLHWTINSPFVQGYKSNAPPDSEQRKAKLSELHKKVQTMKPDASFAIGFGASEETATTSGQITSLEVAVSDEDIYSSWIGAGLGVGVSGGLVMLFDKKEILELLFKGWSKYRLLLNDTSNLKGNQIETWNGQWLSFALHNANYEQQKFAPVDIQKETAVIPTQSWIKVLFALARKFPNDKLTVYIYSLGQTNTTVGFIEISLPEIKREIDMYDRLFGESDAINKKVIDDVYNTQYSFKAICQHGTIGLKEIEPKDLREYYPGRKKESNLPKIKDDEKSIINYNIYLSWVMAMVNNKSIIDSASDTANFLLEYEKQAERGKKNKSNNVESLLESISRRSFVDNLIPILNDGNIHGEFFNNLVEEIDKMQADKFPYFLTLVKFKYAYLKNKKS